MLKTSRTVLWVGAACGLALCGVTRPAFAQDPCEAHETGKCTASDAETGDRFGHAVAIDGDFAIMGAPHDDDLGAQSGSVHFFHFDGAQWVPQPKVVASDGLPEDFLGQSVAINGNVAVLAAPGDDHAGPESGSAYVCRFNGTTWGEEAKLTASDAFFFDIFGESVSVHGGVVMVGAPQPLSRPGAVYAFRYNSVEWVEEDILTASDGGTDDQFGVSVSLSGTVALIGANHDDEVGDNAGAAYIFQFNSETGLWNEQVKLTASDATPGDGFGISVSLDGNVALIGANNDDPQADDSGSAYVFRFDGASWAEEVILTGPTGAPPDDDYGLDVSISGDLAVV
ncbi:MAG: FG-GAP repeat protein, partial [Planctomycetota bacterium]